MTAKFLFAWGVIIALVSAGFFGIANIGGASAVTNPDIRLNLVDDPEKPITLKVAGSEETTSVAASRLVGINLRNPQNELVGEIRGLADDSFTGKTYAVLIYSAPPIRREKDVIVPLAKIEVQPEKDDYRLDIGRYQLENAPAFEAGDFTNTHSAYWNKGNRKYLLDAPITGSIAADGLFDRFLRGVEVLWSRIAG